VAETSVYTPLLPPFRLCRGTWQGCDLSGGEDCGVRRASCCTASASMSSEERGCDWGVLPCQCSACTLNDQCIVSASVAQLMDLSGPV
jgi:hypothetical protein